MARAVFATCVFLMFGAFATANTCRADDPAAPTEFHMTINPNKYIPEAKESDSVSVISRKGVAHLFQGKIGLAVKELGMAIARQPNDPDLYREGCWAYEGSEGYYDLALADCDKAVALATEQNHLDASLFLLRGQVFKDGGQYARAIADYDRALEMDGTNENLLLFRCEARARWGQDLANGWNDCAAYNNKMHGDGDSFEAMSLIRYRMKNFSDAAALAEKAVALDAKDPLALYLRGLAKRQTGDITDGNADIAAAKAIDPKIAQTYAGYGVTP